MFVLLVGIRRLVLYVQARGIYAYTEGLVSLRKSMLSHVPIAGHSMIQGTL